MNKQAKREVMVMQTNGKKLFLTCLLTVIFLFLFASLCFAKEPSLDNSETGESVSIDFDNVDIKVFIKFISKLTNKNFVVDNRIKGNVTVISPSKISIKEAYKVFESVLEIHGFSTVTSGEVIKVVPLPAAKTDNIDTRIISGQEEITDRLVTRMIPLKFADSEELKKLFAPLLSKGSVILSYRDTNMLIVTASLSSIERLLKIVSTIDVPSIGKKISVIPIKHADANKLVKNLSNVFTARAKGEKGKADSNMIVQFVADERTNSIILLASKIETHRVEELIALLDQVMPKGDERIRVYYLEHASAEDLAKVLQEIPTEENKKAAGKKEAAILSQKVYISADKTTNSLIIMAEKEDYPVLEEVISKLDIPRAMVYIECLIMEVNVTSGLTIGTEWRTSQAFSNDQKMVFGGFGGTGDSGYSNISSAASGSLPKGFSLGVLGKAFNIGGVTFTDIQAVVEAFQNNKNVNILSTPQILTTENEEAVITVGKNVPYQTRSAAESGTDTYSSYEYKDVGISLKITPQISKGKLVRLDVFQELTKLDTANQSSSDRPTTLKRQIETTIIVEDEHSVVIGGLIDESMTSSSSKTPCLGDIPVLGWAFKNVSEGQEKTNLYVFITPRVIKDSFEAQQIYKKKRQDADDDFKKGEVSLYDKISDFENKRSDQPSEKTKP